MKKLLFGLIATVMFSSVSFAQQIKATDYKPMSVRLVGKLHGLISVLETKGEYSKSTSAGDFVAKVTVGVKDQEFLNLCKPYLTEVYNLHTQKLTQDQVYDKIDGAKFAEMSTKVRDYYVQHPELAQQKFGWFNAIRKIIDIIDDWLQEISE